MKKWLIRPKWWLLYLCAVLILGIMWIEVKKPLSQADHIGIEAGLVFILYGLTATWLNANEGAILSEQCERDMKPASGEVPEGIRVRQIGTAGKNGNNGHEVEQGHAQRLLPVWVISFLAIVMAIFRAQDR